MASKRKSSTSVPLVSVIIPFYNCKYISQAIDSVLAQDYRPIEIIVVDDGSTSHTELLTPYLRKIHYIRKENGGTASALNAGIHAARGEYFTWLSSDDLYVKNKITKQVAFMKEKNANASFTAYWVMDAELNIHPEPVRAIFPTKAEFLTTLQKGCPIHGCSVMLRKNVIDGIGLFDESLPYTHDYDFWLRLIQHYEMYYLNEPLVCYRVHENMGTKRHEDVIPREIAFVQQKYRKKLRELIRKENAR